MLQIIRHYGVLEKKVRAISIIYKNSKSRVIVDDKLTEDFDVTTGVTT
jgi:hypothetical protein